MTFQPTEHFLIVACLYLVGPITRIIMVSAKTWHTDSDGILCSGNDAVTSLWVVLKAKDELCQHLGIHVRQFYGPNPLYLFAS